VAHIYGQGNSDMELKGGSDGLLGQLYSTIEAQLANGDLAW